MPPAIQVAQPSLIMALPDSLYQDTIHICNHKTMAPPWHYGTMAQWHHGTIAPWHHVTMAPCHKGTMASLHHVTMAPCHHCTMAPWHHGTMAPSQHLLEVVLHCQGVVGPKLCCQVGVPGIYGAWGGV